MKQTYAQWAKSKIIDTVMQGCNTDTNAALTGVFIGTMYKQNSLTDQWIEAILNCRPSKGNPDAIPVHPKHYWPVDTLELTDALVHMGQSLLST